MATTAKPAATQNASAKPSVRACGWEVPSLTRFSVRVVDTVVRIATPSAPPICWLVLMSPDARPASWGGTPASAAIETGTNEKPEADADQHEAAEEVDEV